MKRLGRRTVAASGGLLLVMASAILGMWGLLREDEARWAPRPGPVAAVEREARRPRPTLLAIANDGSNDGTKGGARALGEAPALDAADAADVASRAAAGRVKPKAKAGKRSRKAKTPPGRVEGRVVDRGEVAVLEAAVVVRTRRGKRVGTARTDAGGAFHLELPPGRYRVAARKDGFARSDRVWVRVRSGRTKRLKPLVLPPSSALEGVVACDGVPLQGARVTVRGGGRHRATTDAEGRFRVEGLREGLYRVTAEAKGYVRRTKRNVPVVEDGGGEVELALKVGGKLSGRLRLASGELLAGGLVFVYRRGRRLGMTRSDAEGRYELGGLDPGPVELFARSRDFGLSTRTRTELQPDRLTLQDLVLSEGPRIEGVLRDAAGRPVKGRRVEARSAIGGVRRRGKSDAQGRYTIKNLYPGRYRLIVRGTNRRWGEPLLRETVEVDAGPTARDLTLPPVIAVRGVVVDAVGKPVAGANVFAIVGKRYHGVARTRKDGAFSIAGLGAGTYELYVRVGNHRLVGRGELTLTDGVPVEGLRLVAREPAQLAGRVLDPQGQPLPGVAIEVRGGHTPVRRRATSGPDGRFVIRPLYDGEYRLVARSGSLELLAAKWKVSKATVEPFAFAIEQGRDLQRDLTVHVQP